MLAFIFEQLLKNRSTESGKPNAVATSFFIIETARKILRKLKQALSYFFIGTYLMKPAKTRTFFCSCI